MRTQIFFIALIFCTLSTFAQVQQRTILDSLAKNASYQEATSYFEKNIYHNPPTDSLNIYQIAKFSEFFTLCGKVEKADSMLRECELAAEKYAKTPFLRGLCLFQRGKISMKHLNFQVAFSFFDTADPFLKSDNRTYTDLLIAKSSALLGMGELEKSKEVIAEIEKLIEKYHFENELKGLLLQQKGTTSLIEGKFKEAESYFSQALNLEKAKVTNRLHYEVNAFKLALIYFFTGRYEKAKILLEEALLFFETNLGKENELYIQCFAVLGRINIILSKDSDAEKTLKKSLSMMEESIGRKMQITLLLWGLWEIFIRKKDVM